MASLSCPPFRTTLSSSSLSTFRNFHPLANPRTIPSTIQHISFPSSKTLIPNFKPFKLAASPSTTAVETNPSSDSLKSREKPSTTYSSSYFRLPLPRSPAWLATTSPLWTWSTVMEESPTHSLASAPRHPPPSGVLGRLGQKSLDIGPQGIMFPMIDSPKSARKAVSYCLFPPKGVRGSAHPIARASGYGINKGYLSLYEEEELLIMHQVECEDGVKKIDEIVSMDGVEENTCLVS